MDEVAIQADTFTTDVGKKIIRITIIPDKLSLRQVQMMADVVEMLDSAIEVILHTDEE